MKASATQSKRDGAIVLLTVNTGHMARAVALSPEQARALADELNTAARKAFEHIARKVLNDV